jgi:kynureninase
VLRLAPAPLFNTYTDVWRAAGALGEVVGMGAP